MIEDAGRRAIMDAVLWLIDAPIPDIVKETNLPRGEAREMKSFAQRLKTLQTLAAKRSAAAT